MKREKVGEGNHMGRNRLFMFGTLLVMLLS